MRHISGFIRIGVCLCAFSVLGHSQTEYWGYFDYQVGVAKNTTLRVQPRFKFRNDPEPNMYQGGLQTAVIQNFRPWLQGSVTWLGLQSAKGANLVSDQRLRFDSTARLPLGLRYRTMYEYRWFGANDTQTLRGMFRWDRPGKSWFRPILMEEVFFDLTHGYMAKNRIGVGDSIPLRVGSLELLYLHETDNQPIGWSHRNVIWTTYRFTTPFRKQ